MNRRGAKYLIAGAHALAYHAKPRFTKDFDVLVEPSADNARRVIEALADFGFGEVGITIDDLAAPGRIVQLGVAPNRIDLMTAIDGVSFEEAWEGRVTARYGAVSAFFLGRNELIRNKRAAGRPQDLVDLESLEPRP